MWAQHQKEKALCEEQAAEERKKDEERAIGPSRSLPVSAPNALPL